MNWLISFHCEMLAQQCFCQYKYTRLALIVGKFFKFLGTKCSFVNKVKLLATETSVVWVRSFSLRYEKACYSIFCRGEKVVTSCLTSYGATS